MLNYTHLNAKLYTYAKLYTSIVTHQPNLYTLFTKNYIIFSNTRIFLKIFFENFLKFFYFFLKNFENLKSSFTFKFLGVYHRLSAA